MLRAIGAVVAGLVAVFGTVFILELIGHQLFPATTDVAPMPAGIQFFVIAAWFLGALAGGIVAGKIAGAKWPVWLIALLVALSSIATLFMIPHPVWMQIATVIAPLLGGFVAGHFVKVEPRAADSGAVADAEA